MSSRPRKLRSRKAGLPPGSLVHIGEIKTGAPAYGLIDFDESAVIEDSADNAAALVGRPRQRATRWANVYGAHDPAELSLIGQAFGLHPLVLEDILNNAQRQKIDAYEDYLYVVLHRYELAPGTLRLEHDQISLVVGRDYVLSVQERPSNTFEPIRQRLRSGHGNLRRGGAAILAYSMLDAVVDSYFGVVEQLGDAAETLENEILGNPRPETLEGIHQFKRCVTGLRRNLYPLREVLNALHHDAGDFFPDDIQLYLRDVYDHAVHILESLEDLRDLASGLLDVYLSTVSHRVNLEVRTLTVVATIFMPATLIAGIFGMNFHSMPLLADDSGFFNAMALMGAIAVVMLLLFWRRRYV